MANVERIVKARSPLDDFDQRAARLKPQDVEGWRELARWAAQQGLTKQSLEAYEKVLANAPNDPEAKEAQGYVLLEGRWVTEEESYRVRGYVKYENEWMTPTEAQMRQANAEATEARQNAERDARDAETQKLLDASRAAKAAERAADEQRRQREEASWSTPVYWGGWGYGVSAWPTNPAANPPLYTP
jgi:tetratricopeptide (TPR) repeat protein